VLADILKQDVQLVVLGMGDARYVNLFSWAESQYPGQVAARFTMDHALAHQIYAGCDMFLMPSQFEPCGLSQLIALRYGTVPIVRETGGLRDTVLSYNEYTGDGNGFSFFNYNAHDMLHVIERACDYYHNHKDVWALLQQRGMSGDYSWTNSAGKYMDLYKSLVGVPETVVEPIAEMAVAEPVVEVAVEEAPKPKKPRAPRKKKVEEAPAEVTEAPVEKPKRTRKKKVEEAPAETAEAPVEKPKRTRKKKVEEAPAEPKAE
jgi:starch synthase